MDGEDEIPVIRPPSGLYESPVTAFQERSASSLKPAHSIPWRCANNNRELVRSTNHKRVYGVGTRALLSVRYHYDYVHGVSAFTRSLPTTKSKASFNVRGGGHFCVVS